METILLNIFRDVYFTTPILGDYILLVLAVLFLILSALFAAAEVAYFSLSDDEMNELEKSDKKKDKIVMQLLYSPQHLISTIIIGSNVVNIAFIVFSVGFIYSVFNFEYTPVWGFIVTVFFVLLFLIVIGQLIPRVHSSDYSLQAVRRSSRMLLFLQNFFKPFVNLFANSKAMVYNRLTNRDFNKISIDELSQVLEYTTDKQDEDKEMLEGIIKFGNIQCADIMTSRVDMVDVNIRLNFKGLLDLIIESGYSRLPVYSGSRDNIKGVLFGKDLLPYLDKPTTFRWQTLIRQPYYVPEIKKIDDLLREFQENHIHLALVVDEYGGISGMVTLEDILEEIVGDISDEFDEDEILYQKIDNHTYIFEAKILLNDFFKITNLEQEEFKSVTEEVETLAGMVLEMKGEMPVKSEKIQYQHFVFEVMQVDNRRIKKVKLHIKNDPDKRHEED